MTCGGWTSRAFAYHPTRTTCLTRSTTTRTSTSSTQKITLTAHSRCTHEPGRFAEWRDEKGRFIKGHPGKAKGCRPKVSKELAERAFEKFNLHFEVIVENVLNSKRVDVQLKLISILMDRFAGRAAQKVSLDVEDATPVSELFADLMRQVAAKDSTEPKDE